MPNSSGWRPLEVPLEPGWALLLYTDGVFEGRVGGTVDRLGHENMAEMLMADVRADPYWPRSPGALLDRLIQNVENLNRGPLDDDVALVLMTRILEVCPGPTFVAFRLPKSNPSVFPTPVLSAD